MLRLPVPPDGRDGDTLNWYAALILTVWMTRTLRLSPRRDYVLQTPKSVRRWVR